MEFKPRILSVGGSFTGKFLSQMANVEFLSRNPGDLKSKGFNIYSKRSKYDAILYTIPPTGRIEYFSELQEIMERPGNFSGEVGELPTRPRIIYISATSVFSDEGFADEVYNELSEPNATSVRGLKRLEAEKDFLKILPQTIVLRSAGLYGPTRGLPIELLKGNFSRALLGNRYVSRIHVADLCRLILALTKTLQPPRLVHGVDEYPSSNAETISFLEQELNIEIPGNWREGPPAGRRIHSIYAKQLLGEYRYPSFKEGFLDVLENYSS